MPVQISITKINESIYRLVVQDAKVILRTFEGSYAELMKQVYSELTIMVPRQ